MFQSRLSPGDIGAVVRQTRRALGLRQEQLAGAARVELRFITDLEAGDPAISLGKTLRVLELLGCGIILTPPPGLDEDDAEP
jgi:y4mF family transcriptional regulator